VLGLCAIPVVLIGIWPAPLLDVMHATVANLVHQVAQTKLTGG
jgi:NADH-quinone oxidoreductase subunit M